MTARTTIAGVRIVAVDQPDLPVGAMSDVTVEGGRIVAVEPHVRPIPDAVDGDGRFLMPGLVNCHDHLYSKEMRDPGAGSDIRELRHRIDTRDEATTLAVMVRNAWRAMAQGVLVERDMGARHGLNTRLASVIDGGFLPGPRVLAAGRPIVMTGGHVHTFGREADGPDECRKAVREQRKAGAKVIKVMASGGLSNYPHEDYTVCEFVDDELLAITAEARKLGLPTAAHAFGADAVAAAVRCGIDSVDHGVHVDDETIGLMVRSGTAYVPTMANMERIASPEINAHDPERSVKFTAEVVEPQRRSVSHAIEAGIDVGVGTDSTGTYLEELRCLEAVGMSRQQVIRAATEVSARICRIDAGVVRPGAEALLTLHEADPRDDFERLLAPSAVVVGDRCFERSALDAWVDA